MVHAEENPAPVLTPLRNGGLGADDGAMLKSSYAENAGMLNCTEPLMLVDARLPCELLLSAAFAGTLMVTVPLPVMPLTSTRKSVPMNGSISVTPATVAPAVPPITMSLDVKPVTGWLK